MEDTWRFVLRGSLVVVLDCALVLVVVVIDVMRLVVDQKLGGLSLQAILI